MINNLNASMTNEASDVHGFYDWIFLTFMVLLLDSLDATMPGK